MRKLVLLGLALCAACSMLRKETSTNTKSNQLDVTSEVTAAQQWTILSHDSSTSELQWRIWPKGVVKYSADSGFTGEVEMMELWKKEKRNTETLNTGSTNNSTKVKIQERHSEKNVAKNSNKITVLAWWWWVIVVMGLLIGWFGIRWLR
ncbi:hypothetical protein [Pedobacter sp. BMA]|uniref:hypothetical protein n=1 Tax=Pedobacter sp. BMA TaxID=1663685 RepID=UPI00064AB996|nr:hypothetical protein [Pedobacter sp. BMA]KLT64722.1 hypothetical protein AB669_13300 [Pedobacter sp. BMA]